MNWQKKYAYFILVFIPTVTVAAQPEASPQPETATQVDTAAQAEAVPQGPKPRISQNACVRDTTGLQFVSDRLYKLTAKFDPTLLGSSYQPAQESKLDPSSVFAQDIKSAFAVADQHFQKELCNLHRVYIDQFSDYDWGFIAGIDQRPDRKMVRYIGLSKTHWGGIIPTNFAKTLSTNENELMQAVLQAAGYGQTIYPIYAINDGADTPQMALLSILAHEMGHIVFHERRAIDWSDCIYPDGTDGQDFFYNSWNSVSSPKRWQNFAEVSDSPVNGAGNSLAKVKSAGDLYDVYNGAVLPSAFGAASPAEDFVETYKWWVLDKTNQLNRVRVTVNGYSPVDFYTALTQGSTVLHAKYTCMARHKRP